MSLPKVYTSNGFPVEAGLEWSLETTCRAIKKGPNYSTLSPDSTALCQGGIMERTQWWFSIVLKEEYAIKLFGATIRISCLASVDQNNRQPRLICNSSEDPDGATLSMNASTDKASEPKAMLFGDCFAYLPKNLLLLLLLLLDRPP